MTRQLSGRGCSHIFYMKQILSHLYISDAHVVSKLSNVDPTFWQLEFWNFEISECWYVFIFIYSFKNSNILNVNVISIQRCKFEILKFQDFKLLEFWNFENLKCRCVVCKFDNLKTHKMCLFCFEILNFWNFEMLEEHTNNECCFFLF